MLDKKESKLIIDKAPNAPGVYEMISEKGDIIYIGKAKDLKKRLQQYFRKDYLHSTRTKKLLEKIKGIKFTTVDTELESIILETNLIKKHQPKYNILMKDDKNYVYIKITKEDFPRIQIVREIHDDGAKYLGPKTASHKVKETFKVLKKIFPFRHCSLDITFKKENKEKHDVIITNKSIKYPCLDYYIKRCAAPCIGKCTPQEYAKIIKNVENFLSGKADSVIDDLKNEMQSMAKEKKFEKAGKIRDKIKKIEDILEKQKVADSSGENRDIINYCITQDRAYFNLFQVRDGKLIGQENFILSAKEADENSSDFEVLEAFIKQYYEIATDIAQEVLIPHEMEEQEEAQEYLKILKGKKIKFIIPKQGDKNKLLEMSLNNARIFADRNRPSWKQDSNLTKDAGNELQKLLKLRQELKRIECYDISHLSGTETVGSMVVFEKGVPKNTQYRKFKIRTLDNKPDDYKSMKEVLTRRLSKISMEFHQKNFKLKKATKKDTKFIEEHNKVKVEEAGKMFYMLKKEKKTVGFIGIKNHSKKASELTNLWLLVEERGFKLGYKLIKEAIKKAESKRVYALCNPELKDYYLMCGFEEIKKLPTEMEYRIKECKKRYDNPLLIAYDKNKHITDESFNKIPNLIILDGGKGQLKVGEEILEKLNLNIPLISIAKRMEEIFIPKNPNPMILPINSEALKLIQRARDEAHRFAITYNKDLRKKKLFLTKHNDLRT